MSYEDPVKYGFEYMGQRQVAQVADLLTAYKNRENTNYFEHVWNDEGVKPAFNQMSGYVFLTNEDYQSAMLNNGKLDIFENCPECGLEGFPEEFKGQTCKECKVIYKRFKEYNN